MLYIGTMSALMLFTGILSALVPKRAAEPGTNCVMDFKTCYVPLYQYSQADFITLVTLENAQTTDSVTGTVDMIVNQVLKAPTSLRSLKRFQCNRYLPINDPKRPPKHLVIGEIIDGKPNIYICLSGSNAMVEYVKGLIGIDKKTALLPYCFNFLQHPESEIAHDAHQVFLQAKDEELRSNAKAFDAGKLRQWLQQPKLKLEYQDSYGFLLGYCGTLADAPMIRSILDQRVSNNQSTKALLIGYIQLDQTAGWKFTLDRMHENESINSRLQAYCVFRFLIDSGSKYLDKDVRHKVITRLLSQDDMSDLIVATLYEHKIWEYTLNVLPLFSKNTPITQRAVIRYALKSPDQQSVAFIKALRAKEPLRISAEEEILKEIETPVQTK